MTGHPRLLIRWLWLGAVIAVLWILSRMAE